MQRYNTERINGLKSRSPGQAFALTPVQKEEGGQSMVQGPDSAVHKAARWRCADLRAEVARRCSVALHQSTIGTWLRDPRTNIQILEIPAT